MLVSFRRFNIQASVMSHTLPKPKAQDRQRFLFERDKLLSGKGACRSWTGDFFEEATARATGAIRFRTDSRCCTCPDMYFVERIFFECKSVGNNGSFIIYSGRLVKDRAFLQDEYGRTLLYWLWRHTAAVHENDSILELRGNLSLSVRHVAIVTMDEIVDHLQGKPERQVNKSKTSDGRRLGYGNEDKGYGWGWTVPFNAMFERCRHAWDYAQLRVYQHTIPTVRIHISEAAEKVAPSLGVAF